MWWNYGEAYASAGMIIVTASVQGGGYGSRLFNGVLEATDGRNVLLNSTEEGLALCSGAASPPGAPCSSTRAG